MGTGRGVKWVESWGIGEGGGGGGHSQNYIVAQAQWLLSQLTNEVLASLLRGDDFVDDRGRADGAERLARLTDHQMTLLQALLPVRDVRLPILQQTSVLMLMLSFFLSPNA